MTIYTSRIITMSIARDWRDVYDFASIPENFQRWAAGLGRRASSEQIGRAIANHAASIRSFSAGIARAAIS